MLLALLAALLRTAAGQFAPEMNGFGSGNVLLMIC